MGIDAVSGRGSGLEAVMHGELAASVLYPTGGSLAIRVAMQILNGEDVSRQYLLSSALIDKNNAGTLFIQSEQVVDYQHQIELQRENLESMLSKYTFLQNSVGIILLLMGMLLLSALYVVHVNRAVKRKNRELKRTNLQVQQQKEELAEANRYIEKSTAQKLQFFTIHTRDQDAVDVDPRSARQAVERGSGMFFIGRRYPYHSEKCGKVEESRGPVT